MTITPVPITGFPQRLRPWNNISPLTHRDAYTHMQVLEDIRAYIKNDLVPHINTEMGDIGQAWVNEVTELVKAIDTIVSDQANDINTALTEQKEAVALELITKFQEFDDRVNEWVSNTITTNDILVGTVLNDPDSTTRNSDPFIREARGALADKYVAWLTATTLSDRGDEVMHGTIRRGVIRKTAADSPTINSFSVDYEEPQTTAAGLTLQALSKYVKTYPEKAAEIRPHVDRLVAFIGSLQSYDDKQPYFGGIASSAGFMQYGCLSTAQCVKGLILAYEQYGIGQWLDMAIKGGQFLLTLSNPNPVYMSLYGVNVVEPPAGVRVLSERISNSGILSSTANAWNLQGAVALMELWRITGVGSWRNVALQVRDSMAIAFTGRYDYFALKATAEGVAANRVNPAAIVNASNPPANDNAWHRMGEGTGKGTIESDSMEYALTGLWHTGYDLNALKTGYEFLAGLQMTAQLPSTGTAAFKEHYNAEGRFVCWPGYFRIQDVDINGDSQAWGGYLDFQGAGELLEWKHKFYPEHYALSLPIINAGVNKDSAALMDENYRPIWGADEVYGGVSAVQGTVPIAVALIGLLDTNPVYSVEVTN